MSTPPPEISVVVGTFNRAERLEALLDGLREQTLPPERFEVVVVDDGSSDGTASVLERQIGRGGLRLRALRQERNMGVAAARERGWRAATAVTIAFTDDDCVPEPGWLEQGLRACARNPGAIVQGATVSAREEWRRLRPLERPFSRTIEIRGPDPHVQTCNAFYPRAVLERVDGFDTVDFARNMAEDADLAWRAIEDGAGVAFASEARVRHGYQALGALRKLRHAAHWDLTVYARHPGLRRAYFTRRIFWKGSHYLLVRALVATALPRRLRLVRAWLSLPYAIHLAERGRVEGGGLPLAPYFLLNDLIELGAAIRASIRYRVPML